MPYDDDYIRFLKKTREEVMPARTIIDLGKSARSIDKKAFVKYILDLMPGSETLSQHFQEYQEGEIILRENQQNSRLFVILEGTVKQFKRENDREIIIDLQGPGDFMGLLSFQTGEPVFTTARASTRVSVLRVGQASLNQIEESYPIISKVIQKLIVSNLSDRYRRVVNLHLEVAQLSEALKDERNTLLDTISELEKTRNLLINQEKMATLGELTAGLAHEINNPASALLRSVDYLAALLPALTEAASALPDTGLVRRFLEAGMNRQLRNSGDQRAKMKRIAEKFPKLSRSVHRSLAELSDELLAEVEPYIKAEKFKTMQLLLDSFQSGVFMSGVRLSTDRISHLVKSLKSYSRTTNSEPEVADIRLGIRETLMIIGNRLKDVDVELNLGEIPMVKCYVGELNQVWTNIIINACDAMEDRGKLFISCGTASDSDLVWVSIADNGPGIPDSVKNRVFDSSFTTKTAGGEFGLGIGLAITQGVVQKHSGTINVRDRMGGGAEFIIHLPAWKPKN
ncbi:MAG: cyclic nucleotide-binding domain-containing protein [Balneolales bacterium]|nr:cyclic nucleotide-binding domain-containing protein [Balneolales bacterium]